MLAPAVPYLYLLSVCYLALDLHGTLSAFSVEQITLFPFLLITLLAHSLVEHSSLHNQTLDCEMEIEEVNLGYSLKSIPISSNQTYLKSIVGKLESFVN